MAECGIHGTHSRTPGKENRGDNEAVTGRLFDARSGSALENIPVGVIMPGKTL